MTDSKEYRAFILIRSDHIVKRHDFEPENDAAALENCTPMVDEFRK